MNNSNFYVPRLAILLGRELMFAQESLDKAYRKGTEIDVPDFDFAAPKETHPVTVKPKASFPTRRIALQYDAKPDDFEPEYFGMGPFQITYNFSSAIRKNLFPVKGSLPFTPKKMRKGEYGAAGWSFRMLYEFLCEAYNGGTPFIDSYFKQIFPTRPVYQEFKDIYEVIQDDINTEQFDMFMRLPLKADGTPDMRYTESKKYMDFKIWQDPIVKTDCAELAKAIRFDIVRCLATGRIPIAKQTVSRSWQKRRADLEGMVNPRQFFYASGQLINHLNIYVKVGDRAA